MTKKPPVKNPRMVSPREVFHLTVTLSDFRLVIWRELQVSTTSSLQDLHEIIQIAMGWTNSHLYEFTVADQTYRAAYIEHEFPGEDFLDASSVTLRALGLRAGSRFIYEYDFGDSWMHEIVVDRVEVPEFAIYYPRCTGGSRAAPPESSGGAGGFEDVLTALSDPAHLEHVAARTWVGDEYVPLCFDKDDINLRLAASRARGSFFRIGGLADQRFPADQLEWLSLADLQNKGLPSLWLE